MYLGGLNETLKNAGGNVLGLVVSEYALRVQLYPARV